MGQGRCGRLAFRDPEGAARPIFGKRLLCGVLASVLLIQGAALAQNGVAAQQRPEVVFDEMLGPDGGTWKRVLYTATFTGEHQFTLSWDDPAAEVRMSVFALPDLTFRAVTETGSSPVSFSVDLTEGVTYRLAAWAQSGEANVQITLDNAPAVPVTPPGATVSETVAEAVRDIANVTGPRWARDVWVSPISGDVTFRLEWPDAEASARMAVRDAETNRWRASTQSDEGSGVERTLNLSAGEALSIATWVEQGATQVTVTATYESDGTSPPPVGPPERAVFTGEVNVDDAAAATVRYTPQTSGRLITSLNYQRPDGDVYLYLRTADGVLLEAVEEVWEAKGFDRDVIAGREYVIEVLAVRGQTPWHMEVYVEPDDPRAPAPTGSPNIVLINTDDQRFDSIRHLPHITEWFVNQGVNFTNGYVTTPSCCPSRASLASGQFNHNNGVIGQQVPELDQNLTMQRELHDAGYFTGFAGKYLHYWPHHRVTAPFWDRWTYFRGGFENHWIDFDGDFRFSTDNSTEVTFSQAIDYIDGFENQDPNRPWFINLAPVAPHLPATPTDRYEDAPVLPKIITPNVDEADRSDKPQWVRSRNVSAEGINPVREDMVRTLFTLDDEVDRLMRHLDAIGELDNTMVIFTSDNGYLHGEHRLRSKFAPYDAAVRVPFLVYWEGVVAPGSVDNRLVSNIDLAPTVLAAAKIDSDLIFDGEDIFSGVDREWRFTEYFEDPSNGNNIPTWASIRNDEFMYTEYYADTTATGTPEFREYYDLANDPYLLVNLLADGDPNNDPDTTTAVAKLEEFKICSGATCRAAAQ